MKNLLSKIVPEGLKSRVAVLGGAGLLAITPISYAETKNNNLSYFGDVGFQEKYIGSSGKQFGNDNVIQATAGVDFGKFDIGLWSNYDIKTREVNEIDLFVDVPIKKDNFLLKFKADVTTYPNSNYKEQGYLESSISSKNLPLDLSLSARQAYTDGLSKSGGRLAKFTLGKKFPVYENASFASSATLTAQNRFFGSKTGFSHLKLNGNLNIPINENLNLSVNGSYQHKLDKKKFPKVEKGFVFGAGLNFRY